MTTHDTAAALEAAIDAVIGAVRDDIGSDGMDTAGGDLDRAITAHVEAEVTRRLAAPDVEAPPAPPAMVAAYKAGCEREAARRRAARAAGGGSYRPEDIIAAGLAAVLDVARPTPDEARRLVDEFERLAEIAEIDGAYDRRDTARTALLRALGVGP